ncbi:G2/mitotic-specific cyclin a [Globisporangium polare]
MIMDDLLCTEESVAPLQDEASALLLLLPPPPPAIDTAEVLDMMLQQEARKGRVQRNAQYLTDVQRHGMEATWRRKICHWMFETGKAFELAKDTVGCAIHFMDQFLSVSSVDKIMLQLLSMVCMYVASKMHESQPISMDEMDLLSQRKFSRDDIRRVESQLVKVLGWHLAPPTTFTFARDFIQTLDVADKQELEDQTMHFLMDATEDYGSLRFKNSSIGISAVHVVWNARRLRPSTTIKDALHALNLDVSEFVDSFRWLRSLHHTKHQQLRFISVEEPKIDPSRSISPTSVEDAALAAAHDVDEAAFVESLLSDEKLRPASPSSDEGPRKKKARHNSC